MFVVLLAFTRAANEPSASPDAYHVVHGWPVLPEGRSLDIVAGVGVDSHGNVFVFHRAGRRWPASDTLDTATIADPPVILFDGRTGRELAKWGAHTFAMPHGLSVDPHDNVWTTDVALNQVFEFSHDGRLLLTLGVRGVAGNDGAHFNRPTKVAFASDGSVYVTDGYGNSRVVKFSPEGKFLLQWGTKGNGPGQFDLPHGIAVDAKGRVYVADRSNARLQIFDANGRFLHEWKGASYGRPFDVAIGPDEAVFIADGGDIPATEPDRSSIVVARPDGSVIERFGRYGAYDGEFYRAHDLAVGTNGNVYVGGADGRVQKFVRGK